MVTTVSRRRWYRAENGEQRAYATTQGSLLYVRPAPQDRRLWEWGTRADGHCHVFGYKLSQANAKLMAEHAVPEIREHGVCAGDNRPPGYAVEPRSERPPRRGVAGPAARLVRLLRRAPTAT